jgi:hypothetical protein
MDRRSLRRDDVFAAVALQGQALKSAMQGTNPEN